VICDNLGNLEQQVLITPAQQTEALAFDSIDYSVALEEPSDCTFLLEHRCDDDAIRKVLETTTSDKLYYIIRQRKPPAKTYTVTIKEYISGEFAVLADSFSEAEDVAKLKYDRGEFVMEPTPPTCRMMMGIDDSTGANNEWRDF